MAFAKAGIKIPSGYGGIKDINGNRIITSAAQMYRFMSNRYGSMMTAYNSGTSKKGVYIGLTKLGMGYSGHVTIISPSFNSETYIRSMRSASFWPVR